MMQWAKIPLLFGVIVSVLGSAGCGGPTPTPTPTPAPTQTPTPSPTPTTPPVARLEITNSPNPVPWSGAPITTGACVGFANTWFYTTVLTETAGTAVNVTTTTNIIDGNQQIDLTGSIAINARGSATVPRQFCFGPATPHTIQATFRGTDANGQAVVASSPVVTLLAPTPLVVIDAFGVLSSGFDLQVTTNQGRTDWVSKVSDGFQAAYPSGQQFGFVAGVVAGPTAPGSRPGRDLSAYKTLQVQFRGAAGGESVDIGIKDNTDPDDGTEVKRTVILSSNWQTYTFALADFSRADLRRMYFVFELIFNGTTGRTVFFRDVRYVP